MAQILKPEDLSTYSIALRNPGLAVENLQMLEVQVLLFIFGKDGARALINEINVNGEDSPKVKELIDGDNVLFMGLRALLATVVCTNLISQNRLMVARQNVTKQPLGARVTSRREEADVVQALAFSAKNLIYAMGDYLSQEGKNPLGLKIRRSIWPARYSTNTSGKMPSSQYFFMGFLPW